MESTTSITDLPSPLLTHILSLLPTPSAAPTSAVSRLFRHLFHTLPSLTFSSITFTNPRTPLSDFINHLLLLRPRTLPLLSFTLVYYYPPNHLHRSLVHSWIRYALNSRVQTLRINFNVHRISNEDNDNNEDSEDNENEDDADYYDFHFADLGRSQVRVLELYCCQLVISSNRFDVQLTSLTLYDVKATDEVVSSMLSCCVNLETLDVSWLEDVRKLVIRNPRLRVLKLEKVNLESKEMLKDSGIEVYASSLVSISFVSVHVRNYLFEDAAGLVDVEFWFEDMRWGDVICWSNLLKYVAGTRRFVTDNMPVWILDLWPPLYGSARGNGFFNLHHLELRTGYTRVDFRSLSLIFRGSPVLERLVLDYCYHGNEEEVSVEDMTELPSISFDIPCLKQVKMKNFRKSKSEFILLAWFQKYSVVLEKFILVCAGVGGRTLEFDAQSF